MKTFPLKPAGVGTVAVAVVSTYYVIKKLVSLVRERQIEKERSGRLIVISGCDTGLGYSMAVWASKLGYKVIAGCLNENGEGAQKLRKQFSDQIIIAGLDVTNTGKLTNFRQLCKEVLEKSGGKLKLWAVIPNAAVCTMGEFFWQTKHQKEQQMGVNFWGTVDLISEFRILLFENKARVIVISSDCSDYPLPYLSTYCASKAALKAWTEAFRLEVAKYGVLVTTYEPRGFPDNSGLFSNMKLHYSQMLSEMSDAEKTFYGDYFEIFMSKKIEDFESTKKSAVKPLNIGPYRRSVIYLLENDIQSIKVYRDFSLLECTFHAMYRYLPQFMADKLVVTLLNPRLIPWKKPEVTNTLS